MEDDDTSDEEFEVDIYDRSPYSLQELCLDNIVYNIDSVWYPAVCPQRVLRSSKKRKRRCVNLPSTTDFGSPFSLLREFHFHFHDVNT